MQIVVVGVKGGTGKSTLVASLAQVIDADIVDHDNQGTLRITSSFSGLNKPLENIKEATYQQAIWVKLRRNKRVDANNNVVKLPMMADESFNYIKKLIQRQVVGQGQPPWMGSSY